MPEDVRAVATPCVMRRAVRRQGTQATNASYAGGAYRCSRDGHYMRMGRAVVGQIGHEPVTGVKTAF